jgi:hypothetical protein
LIYRYVLFAYAGGPHEDVSFPIAAVCVPFGSEAGSGVIFVGNDWEKTVNHNHRDYIEDSLQDWANWMEREPGMIPPNILDLSVGPFRTVQEGECDEQHLDTLIERFFTGSYRHFASH